MGRFTIQTKMIAYLGVLAMLSSLVGCASSSRGARDVMQTEDAPIPVTAAFVYKETVHAVGMDFSLEKYFWKHCYPVVAKSFTEAQRYRDYDEALRASPDLIVICQNTVHGGKRQFKFSMVMKVRDSKERLVTEEAYKEKLATPRDANVTFEAIGLLMQEQLSRTIRIRKRR